MSYQKGMLLFLVLCLGNGLKAEPVETTTGPSDIDLSCIEDVEGTWLSDLEPWSSVPPEVLQQWNVNEESILEVSTDEVVEPEPEATTIEPSVTEASVSAHPEHHNHASPLKVTVDGLRRKQLLNPNKDYTVVVESFIGAVSHFLVVVSPYSNSSECGSGGFLPPSLDVENKAWTHAEDQLPQQGNSSVEVGSCFFSAQGQLAASDHVLLTFTPPECGCVSIRGYIAVVNGNHSEVAGPQEVPDVLDKLLCVDPHPQAIPEDTDDEENEAESTTVDPLVENAVVEGEMNSLTKETSGKANRQAGRKIRRKNWIKKMKKTRGRAGWRKFKKQKKQRKQAKAAQRNQQENDRTETQNQDKSNPDTAPWKIVKTQKPWKQQRKHVRQHKKHGKAGKWGRKGRHNGHSEDGETEDQSVDGHHHHNGTDEFHDEEFSEEDELEAENNALVDELLGGTDTEEGVTEKQVTEDNMDENEVDTTRPRKGHWKGKAKRKWHKRKSDHAQGVRFCCSQGIRTKKSLLRLPKSENMIASNDTTQIEECISSENVVTIFAGHNFSMNKTICNSKFSKCCNNFTQNKWDQIVSKRQQKKQARKLKRQKAKQNKHARKQAHKQHGRHPVGRRQEKKQERKQERKQIRQQNRRNNIEERQTQV